MLDLFLSWGPLGALLAILLTLSKVADHLMTRSRWSDGNGGRITMRDLRSDIRDLRNDLNTAMLRTGERLSHLESEIANLRGKR